MFLLLQRVPAGSHRSQRGNGIFSAGKNSHVWAKSNKVWRGSPDLTFLLLFYESSASCYFFITFQNSSFVSKSNKIKWTTSNKAHSIVWFERRQHLAHAWLIHICHLNKWFSQTPNIHVEAKNKTKQNKPNPMLKFWQIRFPGQL